MKNVETIFTQRLSRHYDELKWLYMELYHDAHAFEYFCSMLKEYYNMRKSELRDLDLYREANPDWYKDRSILGMLMYTQCFGGTLTGVKKHLDYLLESGINYVHLMPLLQSPAGRSDGGYAVADFRCVQPELGTMEDLADLADECHRRNMAVCLDFVMNHTSEDHEWARRARAGEIEYQNRYFFYDNWDIPNAYEQTVPQVFPTTAPGNFSWCEEAGKVVMTTFYPYQWDLNYANPTVFNDMTANMLFLCNQGVDVIRLDAVPYIWKTLGTDCRNLPQVHTLVRLMRMACEIVCPGTLLLGEVVMEPSKVVPYFGTVEKPECHMLYNVTTMASTWHTVATHDARLLRQQLDTVFALPNQYTFLNYLRCHDDIGWGLDYNFLKQFGTDEVAHKKYLNDYLTGKIYGIDARGELYNDDPRLGDARLCGTTASLCGLEAALYERNEAKVEKALHLDEMLHAFLLVQSGIPVLYSGDEVGQLNDYTYHQDPLKWEDSRYLHRGNMDWEAASHRDDVKTPSGYIYQALRRLEAIRNANRAFCADADTWTLEPYNDHILAIGRYFDGQKLIALFNFSEQPQTAWLNEAETFTNLITGENQTAQAVSLEGYGFAYLLKDYTQEKKEEMKLIFLDIDGTLTKAGENTPPESALKAIRSAQAKGHKVFLCTGRNLDMLSPLLKYGFDGVVASAGGYVVCEDNVLFDCPMEQETLKKALDILKQHHVFRTIEAKDGSFGDTELAGLLNKAGEANSEIERWRKALAGELNIRPMEEYDGRPIYKIVIMAEKASQLEAAKELLDDEYNLCLQDVPAHMCVNGEFINRRFDKGRGVLRVCEYFGVSAQQTIGFGDSMNDLEMIETVGTSVCMANGSPRLKAISDIVCDSVENDGLAKTFYKLGLC